MGLPVFSAVAWGAVASSNTLISSGETDSTVPMTRPASCSIGVVILLSGVVVEETPRVEEVLVSQTKEAVAQQGPAVAQNDASSTRSTEA